MAFSELAIPFVSGGEVMAAGIVLPLVGMLVVAARLWLRFSKSTGLGADDYFIITALIFNAGMGVCLIYGVAKKALGYPTPQLPNASPETQLTELVPKQRLVELLDWITWMLMVPANGGIKLSCIFLYRRLFVVYKNSIFDITTKALLVICGLWTVAFWFATLFGCGKHFTYPWGPLGEIGACDTNRRLDGLMVSDLVTDVLVWLVPIPMVWTLNMKKAKKLSITGILLLAAMSLAAALVRLFVQFSISTGGYAAHTDVDLTLTILLYWSMIETGLAIIAACLPTLQSFVFTPFVVIKSLISSARSSGHPTKHSDTQWSHSTSADSAHTLRDEPSHEWEIKASSSSERSAFDHRPLSFPTALPPLPALSKLSPHDV